MWAIGKGWPQVEPRYSGNAGFTLIEALVVIAVTALVSGIIFPSLERSIGYWEFRSSATAVQAALERSRAAALRESASMRFVILSSGTAYAVSGEAPTALPHSVRIAATDARPVDFYRDGSSNGGKIELSAGDRRTWFTISPDTGLTGTVR